MHEIVDLVEIWQGRPIIEQADQDRSLRAAQSVVVHPGTTQCVSVSRPVLADVEFEELSEQGMLWEFYAAYVGVAGAWTGHVHNW